MYVRTGGVWKAVNALHVRTGGVWKAVNALHVRTGGVWKLDTGVGGGGGGGGVGPGPSGQPFSVTRSVVGGKINLDILLADVTAQTRVYRRVGGDWNLITTLPPNEGFCGTGYTSGFFGASHFKNGQESGITSEA